MSTMGDIGPLNPDTVTSTQTVTTIEARFSDFCKVFILINIFFILSSFKCYFHLFVHPIIGLLFAH